LLICNRRTGWLALRLDEPPAAAADWENHPGLVESMAGWLALRLEEVIPASAGFGMHLHKEK